MSRHGSSPALRLARPRRPEATHKRQDGELTSTETRGRDDEQMNQTREEIRGREEEILPAGSLDNAHSGFGWLDPARRDTIHTGEQTSDYLFFSLTQVVRSLRGLSM
jgi:hypothetical protein